MINDLEMNPHPPFVEEKDVWDPVKPDMPIEHQVMKMTGEDYDKLVTNRLFGGPATQDTTWVILFVNKGNDVNGGMDDKRALQNYKRLALKYAGKVRFAWVDQPNEELLAATFSAMFLPQTFVIKEGMAYWYRDFAEENIMMRYLETDRHVNSTTSFAQPRRFYPF